MSLNYNILETIKLYDLVFKSNMFWAIILSVIILNIVFVYNKKITKYIILTINNRIIGIKILFSILYFDMFFMISPYLYFTT